MLRIWYWLGGILRVRHVLGRVRTQAHTQVRRTQAHTRAGYAQAHVANRRTVSYGE